MTVTTAPVSVAPHPAQFSGTAGERTTFTPTFFVDVPWYQGVAIEIIATGQIWSGYWCTGLTPPGGWSEQDVDGNTDFLLHNAHSHPQSLIATLDSGGHWFFVGTGNTIVIIPGSSGLPPFGDAVTDAPPPLPPDGPSAGWPPPTRRLALAVNRTNATSDEAGDHAWDVNVTMIEPDWIPNPAPATGGHWNSMQACTLLTGQLADQQGVDATDTCDAVGAALRAITDRWTLFNVSSAVAGGCLVAAVTFAAAIAAADAAARAGAQQAASTVLGSIIQTFATTGGGVGAAGAALAPLITPTVCLSAAQDAINALWGTVTAGSSPLAQQLWTGIIVWGLVIIMAIAVIVAVALLLSQLTLAADVDNDVSNWEALIAHVQSLLDALTTLGCAAPPDGTLPTCPAVSG